MSSNPRIPYRMADRAAGLPGPGSRNLIVHLVVNVEAWQFDHAMPRKIIPRPPWRRTGARHPQLFLGRIRHALRHATSSRPLRRTGASGEHQHQRRRDRSPTRTAQRAMLEAQWEFIGHGYHQRSIQAEKDEAGLVGAALERLKGFTGQAHARLARAGPQGNATHARHPEAPLASTMSATGCWTTCRFGWKPTPVR